MNIKLVDQSEIKPLLEHPFNPPTFSPSFSEDDFRREYWRVHSGVAERFRSLGEENDYGDGDFLLNQDYTYSRFIGVELTSKKMWSRSLIETLQNSLKQVDEDYLIYVDHDVDEAPLFFILVQRNDVTAYFEDKSLACLFDAHSGSQPQ